MTRRIFAAVALIAAFLTIAGPAAAKGPGWDENMPVAGSATITGPGLDHPLVLHWTGDCLMYCEGVPATNPFVDLVSAVGVTGAMRGSVFDRAPTGSLGPKYDVAVAIETKTGGTVRVAFDVYPYGPGDFAPYVSVRPWFHIPAGQHGLFDADVDPGWRAGSPLLLGELRGAGLPSRREAFGNSSGASGAGVAAGVAGFALLILAGAVAGRPRRRNAVRSS
ncbi:MAG: hypothetical protein ABR600_12905 [Actinomycetota bacterium]